jgi:hypothetical protein
VGFRPANNLKLEIYIMNSNVQKLLVQKTAPRNNLVLTKFTPAKAKVIIDAEEQFLLDHPDVKRPNRHYRQSWTDKYAQDMADDNWLDCVDPIVFNVEGRLVNGQHRLKAIIQSGTTQYFYVRYNFPKNAMLNMDTQGPRTAVDNAHLSETWPELTNEMISWSRAITVGERGAGNYHPSPAQKVALARKHQAVLEWLIINGPKGKNIRNAPVMAAIGRAFYHGVDLEKLARFCEVLGGATPNGKTESAAHQLRDYLRDIGQASTVNAVWRETFLKVMQGIKRFLEGKETNKIYAVKEEIYPLPKHLC